VDLTAENVYATFFDSLALDTEPGHPKTKVKGLATDYVFNTERLSTHRDTVRSFLGKLSTRFFIDRGGGHSFLAFGTRRDGVQWGDIYDMERLLVLSLGLGLATFCLKRRRWHLFPRGMPFVGLNSDLLRIWATFKRVPDSDNPKDVIRLSFDPDNHPPPPAVGEDLWYQPSTFRIADLSSTPKHVAEAFYISVVVDGFFDDALPSWILDPETTLQVY
jgi:hypothetical protein